MTFLISKKLNLKVFQENIRILKLDTDKSISFFLFLMQALTAVHKLMFKNVIRIVDFC